MTKTRKTYLLFKQKTNGSHIKAISDLCYRSEVCTISSQIKRRFEDTNVVVQKNVVRIPLTERISNEKMGIRVIIHYIMK